MIEEGLDLILTIGLMHYLIVSGSVFALGSVIALGKRNAIDYVKNNPKFKKKLEQCEWTTREKQLLGLKKYPRK